MTIGQGCSLCVAQKEETAMREGLEVTQLVNADLNNPRDLAVDGGGNFVAIHGLPPFNS